MTMERLNIKEMLLQYVGGNDSAQSIPAKAKSLAAYQFGVQRELYEGIISFTQFVNITYKNQTHPSPLEINATKEAEDLL